MDTKKTERTEALLRSILAHQVAFANSMPLLLGVDDATAKAYSDNYNKTVEEATKLYLDTSSDIIRK